MTDPRDAHAVTLDEMRSFRAASDPGFSRSEGQPAQAEEALAG